ncbi:dynamin-related GTPase [Raphidocelis subcapitata]|uniref:Dynamin-related GTPase n=1 Tax=Raphidocelis subcapitata TaxID=307507 RepID=A0A2V0NPP1_9CHLO|nr:dynamin-related GTPase [Raphidocelis subcapitata]|eukprot:GBF88522.1 dynamin-related GTPase [Raphidocelis subcapitata]
MTDKVEIPTIALTQVVERLTERRIAVEKAVTTLGEAPSGLRDVFELCRGFERAFTNIVNESPAANKIKEAFFSEKGLAGNVQKLPLEKVFELESIKKITKIADGYQPHMVSPERGLRLMATRALDQVEGPVTTCVSAVYSMLVSAAREAAAVAGEHTEAALSGKVPLNVPEFKNFIMPAVIKALDEWRLEAEKMSKMLVDMERSYITAGFFRYTMYRRYAAMQQQNVLQAALAKGQAKSQKKGLANFLPGSGGGGADQDGLPPPAPGSATPPAARGGSSSGGVGGGMNLSSLTDPSDYLASHLDKKVNEDSARGSLPVQGWRWQKRFFIVSDSQRALFYFKTPDDVPKPNGLRARIDLTACIVDDLDEAGNARPQVGSAMVEMQRGDKASLLLRVRSADPRRPCVKDHNNIVLRAENVHSKYEWIARLQRATVAAPATQQQQLERQSQNADSALSPSSSTSGEVSIGLATVAGPPPPGSIPVPVEADLERRLSLDNMSNTRLGQGAKFFRADDLRDDHGRLLPAPGVVLLPGGPPAQGGKGAAARLQSMISGATSKPLTVQETWEGRYDQLMEQFGQDMCLYMRMVCDTIVTTVPKSVVHCLVRKAEKNLLNHLFGYVHKMSPEELNRMLQEDDSVVRKRVAVRELYDRVKMSIDDVQYLQEKIKRKDLDGDAVAVNAEVLALAAMTEMLTGDQRRRYSDLIKSPHLPEMRPPVPLSHMDRPKRLPSAPQSLLEGGAGSGGGGGSGATSPKSGAPRRAAPPGPPGRVSSGGAANGVPQTPTARRAPPPPPK